MSAMSASGLTIQCDLTVTGQGDLGNLVWDVTNGQEGLRGPKLEEGFKSDALKIECDFAWVKSEAVKQYGYQATMLEAEKGFNYLPYGKGEK